MRVESAGKNTLELN
uniref:Uncharacterized protein n=1 Tax=Arundo donax TaxID=35708 RepID=A0A0A9BAN6_ARUDO